MTDVAAVAHVPVLRSEGQRMLLHVSGSLAAIAAEVGAKSPQSVHDWRTGRKMPNPAARARIEAVFGIPAKAWSQRPAGNEEPQQSEPEPLPEPGSTLEDCLALLAVIRRDRSARGLLPGERVKLAAAETQILALRARLEQAAELSEDRYVREHPAWQRLQRIILHALEPHPAASRAVLQAIEDAFRERT